MNICIHFLYSFSFTCHWFIPHPWVKKSAEDCNQNRTGSKCKRAVFGDATAAIIYSIVCNDFKCRVELSTNKYNTQAHAYRVHQPFVCNIIIRLSWNLNGNKFGCCLRHCEYAFVSAGICEQVSTACIHMHTDYIFVSLRKESGDVFIRILYLYNM